MLKDKIIFLGGRTQGVSWWVRVAACGIVLGAAVLVAPAQTRESSSMAETVRAESVAESVLEPLYEIPAKPSLTVQPDDERFLHPDGAVGSSGFYTEASDALSCSDGGGDERECGPGGAAGRSFLKVLDARSASGEDLLDDADEVCGVKRLLNGSEILFLEKVRDDLFRGEP